MDDFKKQVQLDDQLAIKIRQYLLNNYRIIFEADEEEKLLAELPEDLKTSILIKAFGKVVNKITFLSENEQKN